NVNVTLCQAYASTQGTTVTTDHTNYQATGFSAGCSGTLSNFGDTATCTITNTLRAETKVTVTKACPEGKANAGDRFQVKRNGSSVGDTLDCGDSTESRVADREVCAD